jgi:heme exporter protein A
MAEALSARGLSLRQYACAAGSVTLFEGLDLDVAPGGWTMLTGPNGSGKTTLLRAIAGLVRPLQGTLGWNGAAMSARQTHWRGCFAYVGHAFAAKAELSAQENLSLQLTLDLGRMPASSTITQALDAAGLGARRRLPFARLSAGQRRRLGLARLMCIQRPLWLLDEPATALDAQGLELLGGLLDTHLQQGGCALVATHQPLASRHEPESLDLSRFSRAPSRRASGEPLAHPLPGSQPSLPMRSAERAQRDA